MNPQDYQTPSRTTESQETKAWFDGINTPSVAQKTTKRPSRMPLVIFVIGGLLVVGGIIASGLFFRNSPATAKHCLTQQQYKELLGTTEAPDALDPRNNFYTAAIDFNTGTTDYSDASHETTQALIASLASLYQKHIATTSIHISLDATYLDQDASRLAINRVEKVKTALTNLEVSPTDIQADAPDFVAVEEDYPYDDTPLVISITSSSDCREQHP